MRIYLLMLLMLVQTGCGWQRSLIYHPPKLVSDWRGRIPKDIQPISYETSQGTQVAFYLAPTGDARAVPENLWIYFNGNGGMALQMMDVARAMQDGTTGALMVDYPGYGVSQGKPSPKTIQENGDAALDALAAKLGTDTTKLSERSNAFGLSLGSASALIFASRHPVRKVVLLAPFTSMYDMSKRVGGWLAAQTLVHRFDNRKRLAEIATRSVPPSILIVHGLQDDLIPIDQGRELADSHPEFITFREAPKSDHVGIFTDARELYLKWMKESGIEE